MKQRKEKGKKRGSRFFYFFSEMQATKEEGRGGKEQWLRLLFALLPEQWRSMQEFQLQLCCPG
jgi:hypothetical protein